MVMLPRLEPSPHQVFDGIRARHAADMLAQQNPAAKAEEAAFRQRVAFHAAGRINQLKLQAQRGADRRARNQALGAYFERHRMEAERRVQQRVAEVSALVAPVFVKQEFPMMMPSPRQSIAHDYPQQMPQDSNPRQPTTKKAATSPRARRSNRRMESEQHDESLNSAQCVRAVLDIIYAKLEVEHSGTPRHNDAPPLAQVAKEYAEASAASASTLTETLAGVRIANGLLGLRIGCTECDPHPTVMLFQRLMGWEGEAPESSLPPRGRKAIWLLALWLLPPLDRMKRAVALQANATKGKTEYRLGAAPTYEPMPPRTTVSFESVRRLLILLAEHQLLDSEAQGKYLHRVARGLKEGRRSRKSYRDSRGGDGSAIDVEELLYCWTVNWFEWRRDLDAVDFVSQSAGPPAWTSVRVDRDLLANEKIALSSKRDAARAVEERRKEAARAVEAGAQRDMVTGEKLIGGNARAKNDGFGNEDVDEAGDEAGAGEEAFDAGMRNNAMEFQVIDGDSDKKLDFDEFCVFIKQREKGPHSAFELRARFDALDADKSGSIDIHEFIRFSLRDALARDSARVVDLLHEWDTDNNGVIDRKEFHRAIKALGFGALADKDDIDIVFDQYDESKDGLIEFKELNRMLRQSAEVDSEMIGGVAGHKALKGERAARLKRTSQGGAQIKQPGGKGVLEDVAARVDLKADSANEVLALLRATFSKQPAKVMQLFREIDQSGDGLISRKEFTLACRALSIVLPKREMMILFKTLDPDGSNSIEYGELRAALELEPPA